jgi:hypothetical protein
VWLRVGAVVTGARVAAARHLTVAQKWGASSGSVTERATAAAVELAMGLSNGDDVASEAAMAVLLREGRTYAEPHFKEVIRRLLETSPNHFKERLRILDAASPDA